MHYKISPTIGFLAGSLALLISNGALASDWQFAEEENGIKSYMKPVKGSEVTAFKGTAVIDAPLEKIAWLIRDNKHRTKWVDRLETNVTLKTYSAFDNITYQAFGLPWPIADRDYVYRARLRWEGDTVVFDLKSTTFKGAPKTIGIRAELNQCFYYLKRLGPNKTHVTVEVHTDPMGILPYWLINLIQKSWPIKTLSGIKRMMKEPFVKMSELPAKPGQAPAAEVPAAEVPAAEVPAAEVPAAEPAS